MATTASRQHRNGRDDDDDTPDVDKPLLPAEHAHLTDAYQRFTPYLAWCVSVAVLGSFQFGWNIGVVNNPEKAIADCDDAGDGWLPRCIAMDELQWGTVVGIYSLGGLVGGVSGGRICQMLGRRATIAWNNVSLLMGGVLMGFAPNIAMLAIGRFLVGVGSGVATAAVPMYISEVSPVRFRGAIGTLHQLAVVVGILLSQLAGLPLSYYTLWRYLLALTCIPSVLQLAGIQLCVETPRYLVSRGRMDEARDSLRRLRAQANVDAELQAVMESHQREQLQNTGGGTITIPGLFRMANYRRALFIAIVAQLSQQLCGINGVIQYSTAIFKELFADLALTITVLVGVVNLLMTCVSVLLVERVGRRALFLCSQLGVAVVALSLVFSSIYRVNELTATLVMLYVAMFAIGLGPIPWMIMSEMFPTNALGPAASVGVCLNWAASFVVSLLFPLLMKRLGDYTFLPYSIISFALGTIMFLTLPETKGKTVEQVSRELRGA